MSPISKSIAAGNRTVLSVTSFTNYIISAVFTSSHSALHKLCYYYITYTVRSKELFSNAL